MSQKRILDATAEIEISNIGGIEYSSASLESGITVLTGKNATNRTSFLQAIMAASGSKRPTLRGNTEVGEVTLTLEDETYTRTLRRGEDGVTFTGSPYLNDPTTADLFAHLLENNEARQAVARGDNLREIIMRPVDTDDIEQQIQKLESQRRDIDAKLSEIESMRKRLPELEQEKQRLQSDISDTEEQLESLQQEIAKQDKTVEEKREEKKKQEAKIGELSQKRRDLQDVERRLESQRESIDNLSSEREELKAELSGIEEAPEERVSEIDREVASLRGRIQEIESSVGDLHSIIQFNEDFLEESRPEFLTAVQDHNGGGSVTDKLLEESESVVCWTCGSEAETSQIESTLEQLRSYRDERMTDRNELEAKIDELEDEKAAIERRRRNYDRTRADLSEVEAELDRRQQTVADLEERKDELTSAVGTLEDEVAQLEETEYDEILEAQREASEVEIKLDRLEADLEDVESEIAKVKSKVSDQDSLEQQRESLESEIRDLRTRVEDLQSEAVEEFNTHMESVLELLEYENLERIWIERTQNEVREGRSKVEKDKFVLHVVRNTDSGAVYEDTVDHLSESERKVTGLVFALAGYLVHDVYDEVPFMVLDSIEAIDSGRIARLIDYLNGFADYLIVALLEEDAGAIDDSYPRLESI